MPVDAGHRLKAAPTQSASGQSSDCYCPYRGTRAAIDEFLADQLPRVNAAMEAAAEQRVDQALDSAGLHPTDKINVVEQAACRPSSAGDHELVADFRHPGSLPRVAAGAPLGPREDTLAVNDDHGVLNAHLQVVILRVRGFTRPVHGKRTPS